MSVNEPRTRYLRFGVPYVAVGLPQLLQGGVWGRPDGNAACGVEWELTVTGFPAQLPRAVVLAALVAGSQ